MTKGTCAWCKYKGYLYEHNINSYFLQNLGVPKILCKECIKELEKAVSLAENAFFEIMYRKNKF